MTYAIVGGLILVAFGMVSSQLFRLKDWLNRQPPPPPAVDGDHPDEPGTAAQQ